MPISSTPIISGKAIQDYIPQRPPIVMVDKFFGIQDNSSATALTITPDNIFLADGILQDGAIVEHIAQSGAMHIGYEHISQGQPVPIGLIGSGNKLTINRLPTVGEELQTSVTIEARVGNVSLIAATVKIADEVIATGKLKVATQE